MNPRSNIDLENRRKIAYENMTSSEIEYTFNRSAERAEEIGEMTIWKVLYGFAEEKLPLEPALEYRLALDEYNKAEEVYEEVESNFKIEHNPEEPLEWLQDTLEKLGKIAEDTNPS